MKMRDEHGRDRGRVQAQLPEPAQRRRPAVQEHGRLAVPGQVDAGLVAATAAERVAAAGEGHGQVSFRPHPGIVASEDVRALLFDLGGVLLEVDFGRVLAAWATVAGADPAALRARFSFDVAYQRHERGEIGAPEYFDSLRQSLGLGLSDDDFLSGWTSLYAGVIPSVPALLKVAAGHFPLYAFTNSNPSHQAVWSSRFATELSVFRSVFVSSELGVRKPDSAAFAAVCASMGLRPGQVMFFDDTTENVAGAAEVGMQAVLVRSPRDIRDALKWLGVQV